MNTNEERINNSQSIQFCGCILDPETQTLQTRTQFVRLRSKLWLLLVAFVDKPNKLILRDSLIHQIWRGNTYTGEQGLTHAICHLRRILKKNNIDATIMTLPKRGYVLQFKETLSESHQADATPLKLATKLNNKKPIYLDSNATYSPADFKVRMNIS